MAKTWVENTASGPRVIGGKLCQPGEGNYVDNGPLAVLEPIKSARRLTVTPDQLAALTTYQGDGVTVYCAGIPYFWNGSSYASLVSGGGIAPPAPNPVLALAGNGSVTATWQAPLTATGYVLTASTGQSVAGGSIGGRSQSATLTGLTNGVAVSVTATVSNEFGSSRLSAASNVVTPTALPTTVLGQALARGLVFWFSAKNLPSPPSNGASVNLLPDISGNGYNATKGSQPAGTWVSAWSNGNPAVSLPGVGNLYNLNPTPGPNAAGLWAGKHGHECTVVLVFDTVSSPNAQSQYGAYILSNGDVSFASSSANRPSSTLTRFAIRNLPLTQTANRANVAVTSDGGGGTVQMAADTTAVPTSPHLVIATFPGVLQASQNGTLGGFSTAAGTLEPIYVQDGRTGLYIGSSNNNDGAVGLTGRIAEIMIFNRILTAAEITTLRIYLASLV